MVNAEGKIADVNETYCRMSGYTRAELLNLHVSDLEAVEKPAETAAHLKNIVDKGSGIFESSHRRKDGSVFNVEVSTTYLNADGGKFVCFCRDITERKRAEDALKNEKQRLANIIEGTRAGTWEWNVQTGETIFNEQWAGIIGYTLSEISPVSIKTWMYYAHPDDLQKSGELLERHFLRESEWYEYESRMKHKNGHWVWVLDRGKVASWTKDGKPLWMFGTHQDITERKQSEDAQRESEERYKNISETTTDFVFSCVKPDRGTYSIDWIAGAVERITGYTIDELCTMGCWRCLVHPDDTPVFDENITNLPEGTSRTCILRIRTKSGTERWLAVNTTHVPTKDSSSFSHVFGGCRDITERKHEEAALKAADGKIRQAKDMFRVLIDHSYDAILVHDTAGNVLDVNATMLRLYRVTYEEAIRYTIADYSGPANSIEEANEHMDRALAGEDQFFPWQIRRPNDGSVFDVEVYLTRITIDDRQVILANVRDITERKKAEEALQHQSASLSILNSIITTANKADDLPQLLESILTESLRLLDFDAGGIYLVDRTTRIANIVHSQNLPKEVLAEIQTVFIDTKPYDTLFIQNEPIITENYDQIAPDRSKKFGLKSIASIPLLSKGVAIGALNIASKKRQVISEEEKHMLLSIGRELGSTIVRMAAEEMAKNASKNLETLFNSIDEMVFVLDMQGRILAVNNTVLKRLSYTPEELTGTECLTVACPRAAGRSTPECPGNDCRNHRFLPGARSCKGWYAYRSRDKGYPRVVEWQRGAHRGEQGHHRTPEDGRSPQTE
jgi:PAS domain S-box-containing protein